MSNYKRFAVLDKGGVTIKDALVTTAIAITKKTKFAGDSYLEVVERRALDEAVELLKDLSNSHACCSECDKKIEEFLKGVEE